MPAIEPSAPPSPLAPGAEPPGTAQWVQRLGLAGLLPFVLLAGLLWLLSGPTQDWSAMALAAYAALIVSFLGGIHWGVAWLRLAPEGSPPPLKHFVWGVSPTLLAWPGVLMPPDAGLAWLGFLLLACYLVDRSQYPTLGLQHGLTQRFRLTAVASLACFLGAAAL